MQYAPTNELGVVFLFAHMAKRLQFRIEKIRQSFPDCIAYRYTGDSERRIRIEFEHRSSSFKAHAHDHRKCDCIVCWNHDWPDVPHGIEVIELKKYYGVSRKVWIQSAIRGQQHWLDKDRFNWALSKTVTQGDLLLMYRAHPTCAITDIFRFTGRLLYRGKASWRSGEAFFGRIERLCKLESPIFLDDLRRHKVLGTASFVRRNMQGKGLLATEYWPYLFQTIVERNPKSRKAMARYAEL